MNELELHSLSSLSSFNDTNVNSAIATNSWPYFVVNEEFDDGCCETVVRTGDSYESVVLDGVSEVHFGRAPRKPRQIVIAK